MKSRQIIGIIVVAAGAFSLGRLLPNARAADETKPVWAQPFTPTKMDWLVVKLNAMHRIKDDVRGLSVTYREDYDFQTRKYTPNSIIATIMHATDERELEDIRQIARMNVKMEGDALGLTGLKFREIESTRDGGKFGPVRKHNREELDE